MVYTEIGSVHRRSCGDGLKSWNGMPRHYETGFLLRRAFPPEKARKIGQTQPSDHRRTGEETKRVPSLHHHQIKEKNTRWKWDERHARTEPNPTPKQLGIEIPGGSNSANCELLASSPNYFSSPRRPEEEPFALRHQFQTPPYLGCPRAQVFSMHDASQTRRSGFPL